MSTTGKLVWLVVAGLGVAGCESVSGPGETFPLIPHASDEHLGDPERAAYEEDAVRLALRRLEEIGSPALMEVYPPAVLVDGLYDALMLVTLFDHPAKDSVAGIHTFPVPETREILVGVDSTAAWVDAWRSGIAETGNPAVDDLMTTYGLEPDRFYEWAIGHYAVLRAGAPLNATALATLFRSIDGVLAAETNRMGGDGNDIRARPRDGGWQLDYSVGFGDCPAGCINRHTWSFVVDGDGVVRYIGSSGDPLQ